MSRPRLCFVVSSGMTLKAFLLDHLRAATTRFDVSAVANGLPPDALQALGIPVPVRHVAIPRQIAPGSDLAALAALRRTFAAERFDIVHSLTPKAGLLSALAGASVRVPVRIHTFTGQVWATRTGAGRALLKGADRVTASLDTHLLADSASQRDFLVSEGVMPAAKIRVLGHGSVNGVDARRFRPDAQARERVRAEAGIPPDAMLFLYLGRFSRDKGLLDLARAFARETQAWLLLVGPDEDGLAPALRAAVGPSASRLRMLGATDCPEDFMACADAFVLPSYREGFGSVILEAAAAGLPAIGTRIYGITDALVDNETGLLVAPRDVEALASAMRQLGGDPARRRALGEAARARALRDFRPSDLSEALLAHYDEAMRTRAGWS